MKVGVGAFILMALFVWSGQTAFAQALDPASATLLQGGTSPEPDDLDLSQFQKVPGNDAKTNKGTPEPAGQKSRKVKADSPPPSPTPAVTPRPAPQPTPTPTPAPSADTKPSIPDQMRTLLMGGNQDEIEAYRKQIHPDDRRNNRIEISFAPAYFYNASTSNYSFQKFTSQGEGVDVSGVAWLSPFFGVHVDYFASLESSVTSSGPKQSVPLDYQDMEIGVQFRKHFGMARKAASLIWSLNYVDRQARVPDDTPDRMTTDTSGLSLAMEANLPSSSSYAHLVGVEIAPDLVHTEQSSSDLHSGGSNETDAVGIWFGGRMTFSRQDQIFWKVKQSLEQNTFSGPATAVDPQTGTTPNGVSVTNSMTVLSVGYTWGH